MATGGSPIRPRPSDSGSCLALQLHSKMAAHSRGVFDRVYEEVFEEVIKEACIIHDIEELKPLNLFNNSLNQQLKNRQSTMAK